MRVTIELVKGRYGWHQTPNQYDMQQSIDAVQKAQRGEKLNGVEQVLVADVVGMLRNMQDQLPKPHPSYRPPRM